MENKVLMHICCAPCANQCIDSLHMEGLDVTGFWYNPNIHPYTEWRARRDTLTEYARKIHLPLIVDNTYGLRTFVQAVANNIDGRCGYCYLVRMEETARVAAEKGFSGFTTSLLISPYQQHDRIVTIGRKMAEKYGTTFIYRDFRPLYEAGRTRARELGFYMQKYCGCIFSEEERYYKKK